MMAIVPELVLMNRAPAAYFPTVEEGMPPSSQVVGEGAINDPNIPPYATSPLVGGGAWIPIKDYRAETGGVGIVGDPSLATPEKGEICVNIITDWLADVVYANWGNRSRPKDV